MTFDPSKRCAECPDKEASLLSAMRFDFAIPTYVTQDQQHRLHDLLHEIVSSPWNQPVDGVHWLAGWGSLPRWNEPELVTFNSSILSGDSFARGFVSEKERQRVLAERKSKAS